MIVSDKSETVDVLIIGRYKGRSKKEQFRGKSVNFNIFWK